VLSKVILPEEEIPKTLGENVDPHIEKADNLFEAIINGANTGVCLIVGIVALLIAVLGLISLIDLVIGFCGDKINFLFPSSFDWSLKGIMGVIFYPLTIILGIPLQDAGILSKIIGERIIVTELVAYQDLAKVMKDGLLSNPRSAVITAYALCGFSHLASMAIFVGGVSAIIPEKTKILSKIAFRSLVAAMLTCLMTGAVAGVFFTRGSLLLGV